MEEKDPASERLRGALEWSTYRTALDERAAKLGAYAEAAGSLLGRDLEPDDVVDALEEWEADVERSLSEAETEAEPMASMRSTSPRWR